MDGSGDAPTVGEPEPSPEASGRGPHRTTWDELSEGRDPTLEPADPHTPSLAPRPAPDPDQTAERPGHSPSAS